MALWQATHGKTRGAYLAIGGQELYVRQDQAGGWKLFVNGRLEGRTDAELSARAAGELAVRCMGQAEAAGVAASARDGGRAA